MDFRNFLIEQDISLNLINEVEKFISFYKLNNDLKERLPSPKYKYYGNDIWEKAIASILSGSHLLLTGPKATGKNVLAENLAYIFNRPLWTMSLNINIDPSYLIGGHTFKNGEVVFEEGPVLEVAKYGGFGIFDEINMAKSEILSLVHSTLDYRRILDIPGYGQVKLNEASRFIATMNYGYIGTKDLNESLISRFLIIDMPVMREDYLHSFLKENTDLKLEFIKRFTTFFLDLQKKSLNSEISFKSIDLRGLLNAINLIKYDIPINEAIKMGMSYKSFDVYEIEIIDDILKTLFESNLKTKDLFNE